MRHNHILEDRIPQIYDLYSDYIHKFQSLTTFYCQSSRCRYAGRK